MDEARQKQIFDRWLSQHRGIFFKVVRAYAFSLNDQDDLFQEISLQVWRSIPEFRGDARESTWIYRVALYTALAWTRKEKRSVKTQTLSEGSVLVSQTEGRDEQLDWLYEQIASLEPIDRSLSLLLLEGYRYREMAELVGISESNVGVRVHRIRKRLLARAQETTHNGD